MYEKFVLYRTFQFQNQETILNQLKEITGVQDANQLRHAYDASNGDITQAISLLSDSSAGTNMCQPAQPSIAAPPADNNVASAAAAAANMPPSSTRPKNKQGKTLTLNLFVFQTLISYLMINYILYINYLAEIE